MYTIFVFKTKNTINIIKGIKDEVLLNKMELESFRKLLSRYTLRNQVLYKLTFDNDSKLLNREIMKRNFEYSLPTQKTNYKSYLEGLKILAKYNVKRCRIPGDLVYFVTEKAISVQDRIDLTRLGFIYDLLCESYFVTLEK